MSDDVQDGDARAEVGRRLSAVLGVSASWADDYLDTRGWPPDVSVRAIRFHVGPDDMLARLTVDESTHRALWPDHSREQAGAFLFVEHLRPVVAAASEVSSPDAVDVGVGLSNALVLLVAESGTAQPLTSERVRGGSVHAWAPLTGERYEPR